MRITAANLPFKSNYRFEVKEDTPDVYFRLTSLDPKNIKVYDEDISDIMLELFKLGIYGRTTVVCDNENDKKVEAFFNKVKIPYVKTPFADLMTHESIVSRIILSGFDKEAKRYLIPLDAEKIDNLFKNDEDNYIQPKGANGLLNRYENFREYLKTGFKIHASRIVIQDIDGAPKVSFIDGRHRYSVLRDMGIAKIPFCIDSDSFKVAQKYNLF